MEQKWLFKSQNNTEHRLNSSDNTNSLISRFRQLATGAYKYNPFLINQVKNLNQLDGKAQIVTFIACLGSNHLEEMNI